MYTRTEPFKLWSSAQEQRYRGRYPPRYRRRSIGETIHDGSFCHEISHERTGHCRFPSTPDLWVLAVYLLPPLSNSLDLQRPLPTIIHYSAGEPFTKYEMCLIFAQLLELPHDHIVPQSTPPSGMISLNSFYELTWMHPDDTPRPVNTQLDIRETEALFEHSGFEGLGWNPFEEWWKRYLGAKPS